MMKAVHTLLLVGGVAAAGWGAYSALTPPAQLPETPVTVAVTNPVEATHAAPVTGEASDQGSDLAALRREVSHLNAELDALRRQLDKQASLLDDAILLAVTPAAERRGALKELAALAAAETEQRRQEQADIIETVLVAEGVDEAWSALASDAIEEAFQHSELEDIQLFDLDCRETLCRIEAASDEAMEVEQFRLWLSVLTAETFDDVSIEQWDVGNGQTKAVAYMARKGYDLPS